MCVYKKGRKFEGILGKNRWRKWCKWEEVYEIHKDHHDEGFTYEFASATMAYINCLRNTDDPHAKRDNCPKPCSSNPCNGPHMSRCSETGTDVSKSYTCHCNPGWTYNSRAKRCDDLNVCGTAKEQCSKTNTIECVEKEGYKHECVCNRMWMGPRCEKPYDACVDYDNPCGQYGICTAHAGQRTWTCKCMEGWGDDPAQEGRDCKRKNQVCDNVVCLNGGECQASKSQREATCICTEEWRGDTCNEPMPSWTMWQPWSKCSVSCGYDGTRIRKRDCDHKDAVFCGPGTDEEHAVCNGPVCKVDGVWGEWIKVTDCSYNCGGGHYIQARNCEYDSDDPEAFGNSCEGRAIVYADCNIMSCSKSDKRWLRVNINSLARTIVSQTDNAAGDWGAWNSWADCSTTCDVGFRSRNRVCLSSIGACVGSSEEIEDCNLKHCDKEAGFLPWGSWTYWTKCEEEVDFCYRYRECPYSITDEEFREACPGKSSQSVPCEADGCGELQEEEKQEEKEKPKEEQKDAGAQWGPPMQAPQNMARERGAAAGESSALGVGSIAALGAIGYMGKIVFTKFQKKRKRQKKKKKDDAAV
nr:coadhesin-like [Lytechinus pictus]